MKVNLWVEDAEPIENIGNLQYGKESYNDINIFIEDYEDDLYSYRLREYFGK